MSYDPEGTADAVSQSSTGWQPIETAPKDDTLFLAYCPPCSEFTEGRMMIWRASILARQNNGTPKHLRYPATHWTPLPPPPPQRTNT